MVFEWQVGEKGVSKCMGPFWCWMPVSKYVILNTFGILSLKHINIYKCKKMTESLSKFPHPNVVSEVGVGMSGGRES